MSESKPKPESKVAPKKSEVVVEEKPVHYPDVATGYMNPKPKEKK